MADVSGAGAADEAAAKPAKRRFGFETVLAVAGALVVFGFFLPWFDASGDAGRVSGWTVARSGGAWLGMLAIPVFGLVTAVLGGLRWRPSRYTGLLTAVAMLVPLAYVLVMNWPWLYTVPLVAGIALIVLGKLARAPWLNLPLGAALLIGSGITPVVVGVDVIDDLGLLASIPLIGLAVLMPACGVWLLWSALRKKNRERPLVVTGCAVIALDAYVAAIEAFRPTLVTAGIGLWMAAVGGSVLLIGSRPLANRRKRKKAGQTTGEETKAAPKKAEPKEKKQPEPAKKAAAPVAKPAAAKEKPKEQAKPEPAEKAAAPRAELSPAEAEKLAKIEKLKKLKKLKLLEARKAAAAKAAKEEAATSKAGEALANEPEPTFAADPTAAPAPENEDREALMQRMGVKPPPPPSDSELEDMLAAFKKKVAGDD